MCFSIFQGQNHTGTPKTSFSDTQNDVFVILASEFKGFIFVCAVFLFWRVFEASESGFSRFCKAKTIQERQKHHFQIPKMVFLQFSPAN